MLEARHLSYAAGGRRLLHDIDLDLPAGCLAAVVGPSGAGKSTLLKVLCGIKRPERGRVTLAGQAPERALRSPALFGYVPQDDIVPRALRVEAVLTYAARLRLARASETARARRVDEVLDLVALRERRQLRVSRLSGGQRKRVSIATELLAAPRVLFLDEPTSGLDPGLERRLMQTLRDLSRGGRLVLCTTHVMESMELVDLLAVLHQGHLAFAGPPAAAPAFFGAASLRELFAALDRAPPARWSQQLATRRAALQGQVEAQLGSAAPVQTAAAAPTPSPAPAPDAIDAQLAALKRKLDQGEEPR